MRSYRFQAKGSKILLSQRDFDGIETSHAPLAALTVAEAKWLSNSLRVAIASAETDEKAERAKAIEDKRAKIQALKRELATLEADTNG